MPSISIKKIHELKNKSKTRKIRKKHKNKSIANLTPDQIVTLCKNSTKTYEPFEDKIEELFKKNKINIISTSYNLEKQIIDDLKKAVNPKNIRPNEDFYSYINDRWIKDYELTKEQKYIIQVDDFRLVQDKVYRELMEIIKEYISNSSTKNSKKAKCIRNAFKAFLINNTLEQTREKAHSVLNFIDTIFIDKNNIWKLLAFVNSNEIISWGAPFVWSLNPDNKNPTIYKCYLDPVQLSLIDINVYFDDPTDTKDTIKYKKNYRRNFYEYLNILFKIALGDNHGFNIKDIFDVEFEILNAMSCELIKDIDPDNYNIVTKEEAKTQFQFDWTEFCKHLGFKRVPNEFITSNINYLLCGTKLLLEKWNTPKWRTYWIYIYIRQQCRWNQKGWENYFNFEGKFVRGQEAYIYENIRPVFLMGFLFNTFLTNEYISRYTNPKAVNYVKTMAQDLKIVFSRILKRNKWLQPKTKLKALKKIESLNLTVGSPELLREDPLLDYKNNDAWGNLLKMVEWRHKKALELVNKPIIDIPVIDWSVIPPKFIGSQAYIVNAYYTPSKNGIYIPLGYIQKPFIDLDERGIEYNLAYIGYTLAHEMSHSLDDMGSKYDYKGNLFNWWTPSDRKQFEAKVRNVIKQYETFAAYDGIKMDASLSTGENLADISGLAICEEYLRDFQDKNKDIVPIRALSFHAFFVYIAIQARQKIYDKAVKAQLKTNPHPMDKYRTNCPLARLELFRSLYNITKKDKMYWASTDTIW